MLEASKLDSARGPTWMPDSWPGIEIPCISQKAD